MTAEQFCYWLQGRAELQPDSIPTAAEWQMIREHLETVFTKITPPLQIDTTPRSVPNHWLPGVTSPPATTSIPIAVC